MIAYLCLMAFFFALIAYVFKNKTSVTGNSNYQLTIEYQDRRSIAVVEDALQRLSYSRLTRLYQMREYPSVLNFDAIQNNNRIFDVNQYNRVNATVLPECEGLSPAA